MWPASLRLENQRSAGAAVPTICTTGQHERFARINTLAFCSNLTLCSPAITPINNSASVMRASCARISQCAANGFAFTKRTTLATMPTLPARQHEKLGVPSGLEHPSDKKRPTHGGHGVLTARRLNNAYRSNRQATIPALARPPPNSLRCAFRSISVQRKRKPDGPARDHRA